MMKGTGANMNKGGFSLKTFLGVTSLKQKIARKTGIPTTREGIKRKIEREFFKFIFGTK